MACSAQVSDLDALRVDVDACDPRGRAARGTDLDLTFRDVTPHVNQDMFFAITQGKERNIESMMVLSTLDDANLHLVVPKLLPEGPSELAFWADSEPAKFNALGSMSGPDHQWTRPVCPNGKVTFTHTTPFQSVEGALATGAVFVFEFPKLLQRQNLFDRFKMWVSVTQLSDADQKTEVQTRAYFRWSPLVQLPDASAPPEQRTLPDNFQVGNNVLGEGRGPIDKLSYYNIEFVIDVDHSGALSAGDFVCRYTQERAPDAASWRFKPDLTSCDAPAGFDLANLIP
jgi:hypothetical protein